MAITMPAEVSAAVTLLGFWNPNQNIAIPILYDDQISLQKKVALTVMQDSMARNNRNQPRPSQILR